MNMRSLDRLICPNCHSNEFEKKFYEVDGNMIHEGCLICSSCESFFRIENGIVDLLPRPYRNHEKHKAFAAKHRLRTAREYPQEEKDLEIVRQIEFFNANNAEKYEKEVVGNPFYKALSEISIIPWLKQNFSANVAVLELGCGTGRQAVLMAEHEIQVMGIDISENMLLKARRILDEKGLGACVDLVLADAQDPPVKNDFFTACIFFGTLHHLPNKQKAIINASRKLASNGLFYSLDPHDSPLRFLFDWMMYLWKLYSEEASDHHLFTEHQLSEWLLNAGLQCKTKLTTYLPPHCFHFMNRAAAIKTLRTSDDLFNKFSFTRNLGGIIIAEGIKKS